MTEIVERHRCTGCTACKNNCPKCAITMKKDCEGFFYPVIDESKCIDCGMCKRTCPVINTKKNVSINKCFVAYAKDEEIRFKSSSGGIFSLLANYILDNNGIVIGAAFDNKKLIHIAISNKKDMDRLRGSKYLQSDLNNIFSYIKENLKENKILFVGTPCQVAGLKSFIENDFNNLICIDIVCHGVPSPKLFNKYIKELEIKYGKLLSYNFRDNTSGWDSYSNSMTFQNKNIKEKNYDNNYMKIFLSNCALRRSCYNCNFKLGNKYSDITLGDFWGVNKYYPEMYNNKGVSCIVINTKLGQEIYSKIQEQIKFKECKLEEIINGNPSIIESSKMPQNRKNFYYELDDLAINIIVKKYIPKISFFKKFQNTLHKIF